MKIIVKTKQHPLVGKVYYCGFRNEDPSGVLIITKVESDKIYYNYLEFNGYRLHEDNTINMDLYRTQINNHHYWREEE